MKFQVILYPVVENEIIRTENCDCLLSEYLLKNTNNSHNVYIMDDAVLTPNAFIFVLINNFIFFFKSAEVSLVIVPIMLVCYVDMLSSKIICYPNPKLRAHV